MAYPNIDISAAGGLPILSGTPVAVNYKNIASYQGYYYSDLNGVVYKLGACVCEPGTVDGVQQYRWDKWSAISGWYTYYTQGTWMLQDSRSASAGEYISGYASYGFDIWSGAYSNTGGAAGIPYGSTGTVYNASGNAVTRDTVTLDGSNYVVTRHTSSALGPYHDENYSKGATSYGYVYGPDGTYPDNRQQYDSVTGTYCWYDGKVRNASYHWNFYPVSIAANTGASPVQGIWSGRIGDSEVLCAACDGHLWSLSLNIIPNMVLNSSLENGAAGWTLGPYGSVSAFCGKFGGNAVRAQLSNAEWQAVKNHIGLISNHTYYYGAWHKVAAADTVSRTLNVLTVFDNADVKITSFGGTDVSAPANWTYTSCVFTAPENAVYGEIHVIGEATGSLTCDVCGDGYTLIDLTALFSDIPTREWCDRYIEYSGDTLAVTDPAKSIWIKT